MVSPRYAAACSSDKVGANGSTTTDEGLMVKFFAALAKIPVNAIFFLVAPEFLRLARIMRT